MPLLAATDEVNSALPDARFPVLKDAAPSPAPDTLDVLGAAERTSNVVGQAYARFVDHPKPDAPLEQGFNPLDHIPDAYLHDYGSRFLQAENPAQIQWIKERVDAERQDQQVLARAGWGGTAAAFAAGQTDPFTLASMALIPGAAPTRAANALRWALANAGTTAVQELGAQALTETRTVNESLFNIGAGAVLGGLLGSIASRVPAAEFKRLQVAVEQDIRPQPIEPAVPSAPPPPTGRELFEQVKSTKDEIARLQWQIPLQQQTSEIEGKLSAHGILGPEQRSVLEVTDLNQAPEEQSVREEESPAPDFSEYDKLSSESPKLEDRLQRPDVRAALTEMKGETGWAEVGGRMIRKTENVNSPDYSTVVGRTSWIPNAEWWPGRPKGLTEDQVKGAVDKALAGEKLGRRERAMVEFMADVGDERRANAEFMPYPDDLPEHARGDIDAQHESAMVARAVELNDAHVERLSIQYPNRAEFLGKIKEYLDANDHEGIARYSAEGGVGTPGFEKAYAEYDQRKAQADTLHSKIDQLKTLVNPESVKPAEAVPTTPEPENHSLPGEPLYPNAEAPPVIANPEGESTSGAAAVRGSTLEDLTTGRGAQTIIKTIGQAVPGGRLMTSPSLLVRKLTLDLADIKGTVEQNYQGVANANPIERKLWGYDGDNITAMKARSDQFKTYLARVQKEGGEPLSRRDFMDGISSALRRGDKSEIPEIAKAASDTRRIAITPLYERAKAAGMLPEEAVLFADSYLTRQFDHAKINADPIGWRKMLREQFSNSEPVPGETGPPEIRDPAEIDEAIAKTTRNVMANENGSMDWKYLDGVSLGSSRFHKRVLSIRDEVLEPFLNSDIDSLTHSYLRSMAPEVEMTEQFGSRDLKDQFEDIGAEYDRMRQRAEAVGDIKEIVRLDAHEGADVRDLAAIRDRLYGIYGAAKDPASFGIRLMRLLRVENGLRLLGGATISHFPDLANVMLRYGAPQTMEVMGKLATSLDAIKLGYADAQRLGAATDMTMNVNAARLGDYGSHSPHLEQKIAQKFMRGFTVVTGETPLITIMQSLASVMAQDELTRAAQKIAAGGVLSANRMAPLAAAGIDEAMLQRIAKESDKFQTINGLSFGHSETWADQKAAEAFESAVLREAHGVTLRPGVADTPLMMSTEWGKTLFQFKSFAFAASRIIAGPLGQAIAHGDMRAASALMALVSMGTLSYVTKQKLANQPIETNGTKLALEVLDKSNLLGWTGELIFPALSQMGFKDLSRWSDRDPVETLGGPTAGTVASLFERQYPGRFGLSEVAHAMNPENRVLPFRRSDLHFGRRMIPGQNIFYMRRGVNALEDAVGDALNLPGKSNAMRDIQAQAQ